MGKAARCGSGRHASILQEYRHNQGSRLSPLISVSHPCRPNHAAGLWRTDSSGMRKYVLDFFGFKRTPLRHICVICIDFARQQTRGTLKHHEEAAAVSGDSKAAAASGDTQPVSTSDVTQPAAVDDPEACPNGDQQAAAAAGNTPTSSSDDSDDQRRAAVAQVVDMLKSGSLSQQSITDLAGALGTALNKQFLQESYHAGSDYKEIDYVTSLLPGAWLMERNPAIVHLLENLTAKTTKTRCETLDLRLVHVYENLLWCRNAGFVGPWGLSEVIAKNSLRQSTSASAIDSATSPSGSTTARLEDRDLRLDVIRRPRSEGEEKTYTLPDDESVEKLSSAGLVMHLTAAISLAYSGHERDLRLDVMRRTNTKSGLIALLQETVADRRDEI